MGTVSVRDLRNYGGQVLDSVEKGEPVIVTRDGKPVAELRPLSGPGLSAQALLDRWKNVPGIDGAALRADIAEVLDIDL